MTLDLDKIKAIAVSVIQTEASAVAQLERQVDDSFVRACGLLAQCSGRIVLIGMGKSGHIAKKISSTFASIGSPAFYIHPAEAGHGDLGMLRSEDVVVILSHSGETEEINQLLPALKQLHVPLIALTSCPQSSLGKSSDIVIDVGVQEEACQMGLAPTASTTAALAMGDALAMVLQAEKGVTAEDFAKSHPSGQLGKQLTVKIEHIMRVADAIPKVVAGTSLADSLYEISSKGLGMTLVVGQDEQLIGIFTDGDLRRFLASDADIKSKLIDDVMTRDFHTSKEDDLAYEVLGYMRTHSINSMPALNAKGDLVGAFNMHDILRAGL